MNIKSFKKACKRYADAHSLPLSVAQETFARFFGYPNFDSALKSMGKTLDALDNFDLKNVEKYWLDFSKVEFNLLLQMLKEKFEKENPSQDTLSWFSKSFILLKAVLSSMNHLGIKPESASELRQYVSIEFLEKMAHSEDVVLSDHPSGLGRYAKTLLPGFDVNKPMSKNTMARDQFGYRLAILEAGILKELESLEHADAYIFLHELLGEITSQKRLPGAKEVEKLTEKVNLLSIYS